jgi:hypothetical protein
LTASALACVPGSAIAGHAVSTHAADNLFSGTWVADLDSQSGLGNDIYLVGKGHYACESCTPPRHYRADSKLRPVGDSEGTRESVTITGPRTIVTHIVEPAISRATTMTVARDNRTATYVSIDHRPGIPQPLRTVYLARRTAWRPRGPHPVSGTWRGIRYVIVPELIRTTELKESRGTFAYNAPAGSSYAAVLGGHFVRARTRARFSLR